MTMRLMRSQRQMGTFNSEDLGPGQAWPYTFTKPEVYSYYRSYHPWM